VKTARIPGKDAGYMQIYFVKTCILHIFPYIMAFSTLHMRKLCRTCHISKN